MSNVYIVTSGEYSDYGIVQVFSTRELAEKYIEEGKGIRKDCEIEEWILDPVILKPELVCNVHIERNGSIYHCDEPRFSEHSDYFPRFFKDLVMLQIPATSKEQAIRRAEEIRTKVLLFDKWSDDEFLEEIMNMV